MLFVYLGPEVSLYCAFSPQGSVESSTQTPSSLISLSLNLYTGQASRCVSYEMGRTVALIWGVFHFICKMRWPASNFVLLGLNYKTVFTFPWTLAFVWFPSKYDGSFASIQHLLSLPNTATLVNPIIKLPLLLLYNCNFATAMNYSASDMQTVVSHPCVRVI